jgi:hypothetical protein
MRISLENLLDFINKYSTEPGLHWQIPHIYQSETIYEIHWTCDKTTEFNWYLKKNKDEIWSILNLEQLINKTIDEKIDLAIFEHKVLMDICFQAVCCHLFIDKANELLGKENLDRATSEVRDLLADTQKGKLKIVSDKDC